MPDFISTGLLGLDIALGSGGLPRGHLSEIYGPEKCGKTALCLLVVSEAQKSGLSAAFVDIDQTLDAMRAARLGINPQELILARPENAQQAVEMARTLTRSGAFALVVVDSITGLLTLEREKKENTHGSPTSRILSQAVRELDVMARETGTAILFTNELRERQTKMYGVAETTPGGIALKLHAAVRLEMIPQEAMQSGQAITGERIQIRVVKSKSTAPFYSTIINIMYNTGVISRLDHLFDLAVELNIINKQGASYSSSKTFLGRGHEAAVSTLREQPRLAADLEAAIRRQFLPSSTVSSGEDEL
jgi:recombination protein RecA